MSEIDALIPHPGMPAPEPTALVQPPPRDQARQTLLGMVIQRTFANTGAVIGIAWLGVLAVGAVGAPFLASSYPLVVKTTDGQWFFPLFRYLTAVDVMLPILMILAIALVSLRRFSARKRVVTFFLAGIVVATTCLLLIHPQRREVFSEHRELQAAGKVQWSISPPVPYSPRDRQRDLGYPTYLPPALGGPHWMGTESSGSDVFSRMIHACRIALSIGFIATGIAVVIGVIVGGLMGYFSGVIDLLGMRLVEIFSAIPTLFLLLTLVAVMPPEWNPYRLYAIMVLIGLTGWVGYARFVRAEFLKLRKQDFVQAAIACGLPLRSVLFRHMLPNGVAPVLVEASFGVASAIMFESVLSFLGVGLVDEPSWGQMLGEAIGAAGSFKWWMAVFPGLAIFFTVMAYNLIGEALRDAIDPHSQRSTML
ncbi:MAG: ABC transporter permease [Phycisphaeraceae bacterium]